MTEKITKALLDNIEVALATRHGYDHVLVGHMRALLDALAAARQMAEAGTAYWDEPSAEHCDAWLAAIAAFTARVEMEE